MYLYIFIYQYILFTLECQNTCFQNSRYTFSRWGRTWSENSDVCKSQGGYLISIETIEEWKFINQEMQNRSGWRNEVWHIGLSKESGNWTWESGNSLNISKWTKSTKSHEELYAAMHKKSGLFKSISPRKTKAFICEMHGGNKAIHTSTTLWAKTLPLAFWSSRNFFFRTTLALKSKNSAVPTSSF